MRWGQRTLQPQNSPLPLVEVTADFPHTSGMFRKLAAYVLAFFAASLFPHAAWSKAPDTLVVGMELAYPPFEMADERGQPAGVSVDLANALGEFLHKKTEIQNLPFDGLIPSLRTGRIDLIISSMTATPERAQTIDFSEPYLKTGLCLLVGKNSGIQSIDDADRKGKTIAVKQGTTGHIYSALHAKNAKVLVLDREAACVLEVVQGKVDAFIYDQMSVFKHWQQNEETTRAILKPFQQESWAIGIRKGNDDLRRQVNAFLKDFREKGGFDRLGDKWLREQKEAFKKLGIPFYF
jgi:polar amino acid transport system substrate-binding protein